MRLFIEAYGAEAGNLALKLLPRGGRPPQFLESFLDKGRMRAGLERIPVHVVLDTHVGLIGAARYAARMVRADILGLD